VPDMRAIMMKTAEMIFIFDLYTIVS